MHMDYVTLGRTGLRASVLGLGGGGHSRLGLRTAATEAESVAIVRRAIELGVSLIDTAEAYGTEELVGAALRGQRREEIVLSTKKSVVVDRQPIGAAKLVAGLEASLRRLGTDYVDIYHLHAVRAEHYDRMVGELVPAVLRLREQGKIRFLGITEAFGADTAHQMMSRAVRDPHWDVIMVGFNILNQSARARVLAEARRQQIGVLCMFAVRDALGSFEKARAAVADLVRAGLVGADGLDLEDPLGFVRPAATSLPDAAYRFCRAEPGIDVVLSGTGNLRHLEQNVESILRPPLPEPIRQRLVEMFARVDSVSGQ
jgi:aryl-alcohol dehydrogenase-like predicted oxidoreductase